MSGVKSPALRYPGAKWTLAQWICSFLPPHGTYCEPFFGSGAVFFQKRPAKSEYVNDLDGDVVNLFRVIREQPDALAYAVDFTPWSREEYELAQRPSSDPVERARRTLVRHWQSIGNTGDGGWRHNGKGRGPSTAVTTQWDRVPTRIHATVKRIKQAQIENRPATELIGRLDSPHVLLYVDPPYVGSTRSRRMYREEMMAEQAHSALLDMLLSFTGMVVLSGYAHPLYDVALSGWERVTRMAVTEGGGVGEEVLWINPAATRARLSEEKRLSDLEDPRFQPMPDLLGAS